MRKCKTIIFMTIIFLFDLHSLQSSSRLRGMMITTLVLSYLSSMSYLYFRFSESSLESRQSDGATTLSFLPKISFVHSLPPRGEWCTELARRSCDWSKNLTLSDVKLQSKKKRENTKGEERYSVQQLYK